MYSKEKSIAFSVNAGQSEPKLSFQYLFEVALTHLVAAGTLGHGNQSVLLNF